MESWTITSSNWLEEVIVWDFASGQALSKPELSNQLLSNQSFKHNPMHKLALNLATGPSFEPRFPMLIVNGSSVGYEGNCRENRYRILDSYFWS